MTPSPEARGNADCRRLRDALAWLQGELAPDRAEDYRQHLLSCEPCSEFVREARELVGGLRRKQRRKQRRTPPVREAPAEQRILQHCAPELAALQRQARVRARRGAAAAAAVLVLVVSAHSALLALRRPDPGVAPAATPALAMADSAPGSVPAEPGVEWIADQLGPDGRFDPGTWSGPRSEEVGMHALAVLALARSEASAPPAGADGSTRADLLRGARWLLQQQDGEGAIGTMGSGAGLDHAIAAVSLLESWQLTQDPALRGGLDRAIGRLVKAQLADGGWLPRAQARGCNPAHTAWALSALLRAEQLHFAGLDEAIGRGRVRLAADLGGLHDPADLDLPTVSALALAATAPEVATSGLPAPVAGAARQPAAGAGATLGALYAASVRVLGAAGPQ